jgi:hypothetical protein
VTAGRTTHRQATMSGHGEAIKLGPGLLFAMLSSLFTHRPLLESELYTFMERERNSPPTADADERRLLRAELSTVGWINKFHRYSRQAGWLFRLMSYALLLRSVHYLAYFMLSANLKTKVPRGQDADDDDGKSHASIGSQPIYSYACLDSNCSAWFGPAAHGSGSLADGARTLDKLPILAVCQPLVSIL